MRLRAPFLALAGLLSACVVGVTAAAQTTSGESEAVRPKILFNRWQENWSVLADPNLRTEPLDGLKYISLSNQDPASYLSLGLTVRERFESNDAPSFGVGDNKGDSYLLDRVEAHADLRPDADWQVFVQLEDVRAPWKDKITPVDRDELDLEQAFVAFVHEFAAGVLKARVGRQEMAFDLQRFVSVRDGPNVRQAYDAAWLDWEEDVWRVITFWSFPVQYRHRNPFDDFSRSDLQYGGFRVERNDIGPGSLAVYYSFLKQNDAEYLDGSGNEGLNIVDAHYAGTWESFDWDVEGMGQFGHVGDSNVRAWATGMRAGYTFESFEWRPRLGLQVDAGSGDRRPGDGTVETFNPLFPNGYYFALAGYTTYVNVIHLKPSLTVRPIPNVAVMLAVAAQWRETTADAVYVMPDIPVAGTAGNPGQWTGFYGQVHADWAINANLTASLEAVHFHVGEAIKNAGGHNSDYLMVQFQFGW